ncbi:WD repeat-containing protein 4 [Phytophthora boehmeriae]|uniref:WD repeat-containing protein 4 n=1 Tax=Phytophthora boehmeriae TaxID=109152 RepID=A0A8T1WQ55_9STRA|nr:WD repeat-containing protein 4 [Phytophthora boehmeriae]
MVATGVFVAAADDVVVTVRNTTVFVLPSRSNCSLKALQFEVLQGLDGVSEAPADDDKKKQATQPAPAANRITFIEFFKPQDSGSFALLLLVDERRLVHYELNVQAQTLLIKSSRAVPRSATCMTVAHLQLPNKETKYAVVVGQKTGEAVAVPFPVVDGDLKTLLGHTTSMVTHIAVNKDSSLLLTADRDEKIRVSRFPTAAIIESYCLGHAASLTKVACSALTPELAVSTSMDNTLKLWEMQSGKLLASEVLLPGVEVSLAPIDEADDGANDDIGRQAAKNLLNVSLAICPKTNVVAVLVNYEHARFFEIVTGERGAYALKEVTILADDVQLLLANEPCELLFTDDGVLAVSYKKNPFLQLYTLTKGETTRLSLVEVTETAFSDFRSAAATIELVDGEVEALDMLEDGLKKKKARTGEWKKKVSDEN